MSPKTVNRIAGLAAVTATAMALGGCFGGSSDAEAAKSGPKGIFTSTGDCVDSGFLDFDSCSAGVQAAIQDHDKNAPTYDSQRACEATEGEGRCERSLTDRYRRRLLAFLVTGGPKPDGKALYVEVGKAGYTDNKKTEYLDSDLTMTFSRGAVATLTANRVKKAKKSSFGAK
jgi:hypothetical protein